MIRAPWLFSYNSLGTYCTPRSLGASFSARRLTPRSSGVPTASHQRPVGGTLYIFATRALAACRCPPLSSYVGPRMPTLTGTSPFFETQGRAPRGTSAFTTFREQFRQLFGVQNPSLTLRRATLSNAFRWASLSAAARRSRATQAARWRPRSTAFGYFCLGRAVASQRCAVQGPTPRSSGAPTAAHQARSVVPEHFPQPGPGVLPLSPA